MDAIDITEHLIGSWHHRDDLTVEPGYEEESFFVVGETGERFLVLVAKVSE